MSMAERGRSFGSVAEQYHRFRPRYPDEVIAMIVAGDPSLVVDVGCGTGIAAELVRSTGTQVVGVEPDTAMAAVARQSGLEVDVATLEDWVVRPCDVLYSAQAWHWVEPVVGANADDAAIRDPIERAFAATGVFGPPNLTEIEWMDRLTHEDAVRRVATHSSHLLMEGSQRTAVEQALLAELGSTGSEVDVPYVTRVLQFGRLR